MSKWLCIENCGACCNLDPRDRPDLADYLSKSELDLYLSMVGEDGWCINYNKESRKCQIYENRPRFCRVKPDIFQEMYEIPLEEFEEFAIDCCHQQIEGVYGEESEEINNYRTQVT
ncbi:YkgJ family cysteine cluster protein [Geminocystis sp.]|uniref:YkgJ family cysteine cluster protein n=1 Tax=Geminocystis sp. TaxID=2664100 RepID=UPI00359474E0